VTAKGIFFKFNIENKKYVYIEYDVVNTGPGSVPGMYSMYSVQGTFEILVPAFTQLRKIISLTMYVGILLSGRVGETNTVFQRTMRCLRS